MRAGGAVCILFHLVIFVISEEIKSVESAGAVLTETEKIMVHEESFLENLYLEISPKQNNNSHEEEYMNLRLKSFLRTFQQTPSLQRRGM